MSQPLIYETPSSPASPGRTQLNIVAIVLIVMTSLSWMYGVADIAVLLWKGMPAPPAGATPTQITEIHVGAYGMMVIFAISLLGGPVVIFGAAQMLRLRTYRFCIATAILAMLPFATNCGCFLTLPLGIWALVVLMRTDVKALFHRT